MKVLARTPEGKDLRQPLRDLASLMRKPRRKPGLAFTTAPSPVPAAVPA